MPLRVRLLAKALRALSGHLTWQGVFLSMRSCRGLALTEPTNTGRDNLHQDTLPCLDDLLQTGAPPMRARSAETYSLVTLYLTHRTLLT